MQAHMYASLFLVCIEWWVVNKSMLPTKIKISLIAESSTQIESVKRESLILFIGSDTQYNTNCNELGIVKIQ